MHPHLAGGGWDVRVPPWADSLWNHRERKSGWSYLIHLREIIEYYKQYGFKTAIDDFGAGYAGLNLLAEIQTDYVKLDMALVKNIDQSKARQAIVKGIFQTCSKLSVTIIAEGVERYEELSILQSLGIELFQGYYFAKPVFQGLATVPPDAYANKKFLYLLIEDNIQI